MAIDEAKKALNFSGGIDQISYQSRQLDQPSLPTAKRIIYFTEDASGSNLSKLFRGHRGRHLVDKVCKPSRQEYEILEQGFSGRQGTAPRDFLNSADVAIDPQLRNKAIELFDMFTEAEIKEHTQRNLLTRV